METAQENRDRVKECGEIYRDLTPAHLNGNAEEAEKTLEKAKKEASKNA